MKLHKLMGTLMLAATLFVNSPPLYAEGQSYQTTLADNYYSQGMASLSSGSYWVAMDYFEQALKIDKEYRPKDAGFDLVQMGECYQHLNMYEGAEASFIEGSEFLRSTLGEVHSDYISAQMRLATLYYKRTMELAANSPADAMKELSKAKKVISRNMPIAKQVDANGHDYGLTLFYQVKFHLIEGDYEDAILTAKKASKIFNNLGAETKDLYEASLMQIEQAKMMRARQ